MIEERMISLCTMRAFLGCWLLQSAVFVHAFTPRGRPTRVVRQVSTPQPQLTSSSPPSTRSTRSLGPSRQQQAGDGNSNSMSNFDWDSLTEQLIAEFQEVSECVQIAIQPFFTSDKKVQPEDLVQVCDELTLLATNDDLFVSRELQLRERAYEIKRYELLAKLMRADYNAYVATASFLSPSRIPRENLPNVQDVPLDKTVAVAPALSRSEDGLPLVEDCELQDMQYKDNFLDTFLLKIFRKQVEQHSGVSSDKPGIEGLLEQGRTFMVKRGNIPEVQHKMVYNTLGGLMTPVLPPFYRVFMSGIFGDVQVGPWFYAPWLTSIVTPTFFKFLVGPSRVNRRKDGHLGGLVVEKCKFLQESGCKGLCLHQCKLPAQQFFQEELGLPLTVSPNFVTQECQWSFGEKPVPPEEDPSFPQGCLVGCESRKAMAGTNAELCSS